MGGSTYLLTYKGSIPTAIAEARQQKKLFTVYISGEDENSVNMEHSTWADPQVSQFNQHIMSVIEIISRCCIFLHLTHGSVSASQFSAIYPQKSVPSITVIGLNGVMLWRHEGYISVESLKENVEKAFAALYLQETAATLLSATLAPEDPEPVSCNSSVAPAEHGVASSSEVPLTSTSKAAQETEAPLTAVSTVSHQAVEERVNQSSNQYKDSQPCEKAALQGNTTDDVKISEENEEITHSVTQDVNASGTSRKTDGSTIEEPSLDSTNSLESTGMMAKHAPGTSQDAVLKKRENISNNGGFTDRSSAVKPIDVHLNIRMPEGSNLQMKLTLADRLSSVKTFVDENKSTQLGSYDLAVPYPRKLFSDQDMTRTLAELDFANREALIVVPHRQVSRPPRSQSSSIDNQLDSSESNEGYFHYVKRFLSYIHPFSYFSGNASSSEPTPNDGSWQYGSNSSLGNQSSSSRSTTYQNSNEADNASRRTSRPFGSNIHTLRHDEDDGPSRDKNVFWNGNSTQFGGDK